MWSLNILLLFFVSSLSFIRADQDWDYLIFTQCWPDTVCRIMLESNATHACAFPRNREAWTIHGIWPSMTGSMGPEFCNQTWFFDPEEIKSIESDMVQGWTNVVKDTPMNRLWAHEWNKHGTCAAAIQPLNSQIKYFSTGLKWLQKYAMATILSESNITPSNTKTYSKTDIYNAIKNKIGVDPKIKCILVNKKKYLWEIIICFSRSLELADCRSKNDYKNDFQIPSDCGSEGIFYHT